MKGVVQAQKKFIWISTLILIFLSYAIFRGFSSRGTDNSTRRGLQTEDTNSRRGPSMRKSRGHLTSEFLDRQSDPKAVSLILEKLLKMGVFSDRDVYRSYINSLRYYSDDQLAEALIQWEMVALDNSYFQNGNPSLPSFIYDVWTVLSETPDTEMIILRSAAIFEKLEKDCAVRSYLLHHVVSRLPEFLPRHLDSLLKLNLSRQDELDVALNLVDRVKNLEGEERLKFAESFLVNGVENKAIAQALLKGVIEAELEVGYSLRSIGERFLQMDSKALAGVDGQIIWESADNGDFDTASWYLGELISKDRRERESLQNMLRNFIKRYAIHDPEGVTEWSNQFSLKHEEFSEFITKSTSEALTNTKNEGD